MPSIISQMIAGEHDAILLASENDNYAFLDLAPLAVGHVIVTPREEFTRWPEIPSQRYLSLQAFAQKVGQAVGAAIDCKKVGMAMIGLQVEHVHIHLVPLQSANDLNFTREKLKLSREELLETAELIKKFL